MTSVHTTVPFLDLAGMHRELEDEFDAAWRSVRSGHLFIGGPHVAAFESAWAAYCGVRHCIGVANGTDAITVALVALGVGPGDEVVVPANTYIATATAVTAAGATPVFADVDPDTLLLGPVQLQAALTPRTAAVVPVHLYGQLADMTAISAVAADAGLVVVEDAAQAHGATWRGRGAGQWGAAATFSFYPGKNLGAFGDGGAVVTDDDDLAARLRLVANHGRSPSDRFVHLLDGRNSRLDGLQAAVLSVKLPHLDRWNAARRRAHERYVELLAGTEAQIPRVRPEAVAVHHVEAVLVPDPLGLARALAEAGVETNRHYPVPCHHQPAFAHLQTPELPVAEWACAHELSLPMFPGLEDATIERICSVVRGALEGEGRG